MVELREPVEVATLLEYLRTRLARYEIPTDIAIVEQIPRTPSGKPDLGAVRALLQRRRRTCLTAVVARPCRA